MFEYRHVRCTWLHGGPASSPFRISEEPQAPGFQGWPTGVQVGLMPLHNPDRTFRTNQPTHPRFTFKPTLARKPHARHSLLPSLSLSLSPLTASVVPTSHDMPVKLRRIGCSLNKENRSTFNYWSTIKITEPQLLQARRRPNKLFRPDHTNELGVSA
jgi:hypothetical protein